MNSGIPSEVWFIDTEWGYERGRIDCESAFRPVVLCGLEPNTGSCVAFWGNSPQIRGFFREHASATFVSHSAVAEMKYLLRQGVELPQRWFDTYLAERRLTNNPAHPPAGLSEALLRRGLPHLAPVEKKKLRNRILQLQVNLQDETERVRIQDYCLSDCFGCRELFSRQMPNISELKQMEAWIEFLKAVARMELRGIPFSMDTFRKIRDARTTICGELMAGVNVTAPVFVDGSFSRDAFMDAMARFGVHWPVRISPATGRPYHPLDRDTFSDMAARHPFIEEVGQVRKTLASLGKRSLVVDEALGRHYYDTSPFRSITGRNQPRQFVFSAPKWMRNLMIPESPDHVLVYFDYVAQEFGIAAALSGDANMKTVYEGGDCHMAFAERAGAVPPGARKKDYPKVRSLYKAANLAALYGQTAYGMSERLGISMRQAQALLRQHREMFPAFCTWSDRMVQGSFDRGYTLSPCGWRCLVPPLANERTWQNWPVQATGADIMRLTVTYLDRQNVPILAPVHDGFLLSCRRDQLDDLNAAVEFACSTAVEQILPGFHLRWDLTVYQDRFDDEDGRAIWLKLNQLLKGSAHERN